MPKRLDGGGVLGPNDASTRAPQYFHCCCRLTTISFPVHITIGLVDAVTVEIEWVCQRAGRSDSAENENVHRCQKLLSSGQGVIKLVGRFPKLLQYVPRWHDLSLTFDETL